MSGIAGIVNLDGDPVDRSLLRRMTGFMDFRGPDRQQIWADGNVGFGHALLRTTDESEREIQPLSLDGRVWIVADVRIDAQADLRKKLAAQGELVERGVPDVELLLRAYLVWGEECVEHILGDFAFAVWDKRRRRLVCGRDHLGVKPFFYADLGRTVIFSNTLDCIRQHPDVSGRLNHLAIADFLLFEVNQDEETTSFADIRRIPPAHLATWSTEGFRSRRYWKLPVDEPIFFKRPQEYTERFKELLDTAVADRLRSKKIGVLMSGGLDSTTLAATACKILRESSAKAEVQAFTTIIDGIDQNERYYAGLVAEKLDIPIHFDSRRLDAPDWNDTGIHTPEPVGDPTLLRSNRERYRFISERVRVLLYGEGPDNALHYEWKPYLSHLVRHRRFGRLAADGWRHIIRHRRVPLVATIPRILKQRINKDTWRVTYPTWLEPKLEDRFQLPNRWVLLCSTAPALHPLRPGGYASFQTPLWESVFSSMDAGQTCAPVETRHPFIDLRLLRYMLAVPAVPWCRAKYLVRHSMRGILPDAVLHRPKAPLLSDPVWELTRFQGLPPFRPASLLSDYVRYENVPTDCGRDMMLFRINFRPLALNYWLRNEVAYEEASKDGFITPSTG